MTRKSASLILSSLVVNQIGDVVFDLYIAWSLAVRTGNVLNAVYVIGSSFVFRGLVSLFVGFLVDAHDKKKTLLVSNMCSAAVIGCFFLFWNRSVLRVGMSVFFVLLNDVNNAVYSRAILLLNAELLSEALFIRFQAKIAIVGRIVATLGAVLAGHLLHAATGAFMFAFDGATFLLSALFISMLEEGAVKPAAFEPTSLRRKWRGILDGLNGVFSHVTHHPFLRSFLALMFLLNIAYGYIPYIMPVALSESLKSPILLGNIKAALTVGEILGLAVIVRTAARVGFYFKLSMVLNVLMLSLLYGARDFWLIELLFGLYGFSDALTQPAFSLMVSRLEPQNRGKILGGVDCVLLASPSLGMYFVTRLMNRSTIGGYVFLMAVFGAGLVLVVKSRLLEKAGEVGR